MPTAHVLHERVAAHDHARGAVAFETTDRDRSQPAQSAAPSDARSTTLSSTRTIAREELIDDGEECPGPIGRHLRRLAPGVPS